MAHRKVHCSHDFVEWDYVEQYTFGLMVNGLMILLLILFPDPGGLLAALLGASNDLKLKYDAYKLNPLLIDALKTSQRAWVVAMTGVALYVDSVANGDAVIIAKSGINATSDTSTPAAQPTVPVIHSGASNNAGGFDLELDTQKKADAFGGVFYTSDLTPVFSGSQVTFTIVNGPVTSMIAVVFSKQKKLSFRGLLSMVKMKLVVWAINSWGASHPTSPTEKGIQ